MKNKSKSKADELLIRVSQLNDAMKALKKSDIRRINRNLKEIGNIAGYRIKIDEDGHKKFG